MNKREVETLVIQYVLKVDNRIIMNHHDDKSTLLLFQPQQGLSLFTLQSNLLKIWTQKQVDKYYQTTVLSYLDNLPQAEAKREIIREHQKMLQNRSQYSRIKQYMKRRQQILDVLDTALEDEHQIEYACEVLDDLRKINLKLCESIFDMKQSLQNRGLNANSICEGYKFLFKSFQSDNHIILNSYFKKYVSFSQGYDPFFLYPYEKMQKRGVTRGTPKCIQKLFKMNISYVYRLIKSKNQLLKSLSYACGETEQVGYQNERKKLKKHKYSSTPLESEHEQRNHEEYENKKVQERHTRKQAEDNSDRQQEDSYIKISNKRMPDPRTNSEPKKQLRLPQINQKSRPKQNVRNLSAKYQADAGSRATIKNNLHSNVVNFVSKSSHIIQGNNQDDKIDVYRRKIIRKKMKVKGSRQGDMDETDQYDWQSSEKNNGNQDQELESSYVNQNSIQRSQKNNRRTPRHHKKFPKLKQFEYRSRIHEQQNDESSQESKYARRRYRRRDSISEEPSFQIHGSLERKNLLELLKPHRKYKIISSYKTDTNQLWKYREKRSDYSDSGEQSNYHSKRNMKKWQDSNKYTNKNNETHYNPQTLSEYNNPITNSPIHKKYQNQSKISQPLILGLESFERNKNEQKNKKYHEEDLQIVNQIKYDNLDNGGPTFRGQQINEIEIQHRPYPHIRVQDGNTNQFIPSQKNKISIQKPYENNFGILSNQQEHLQNLHYQHKIQHDSSQNNLKIKQYEQGLRQNQISNLNSLKGQGKNLRGNDDNLSSNGVNSKYYQNQNSIPNQEINQYSQNSPVKQFDNMYFNESRNANKKEQVCFPNSQNQYNKSNDQKYQNHKVIDHQKRDNQKDQPQKQQSKIQSPEPIQKDASGFQQDKTIKKKGQASQYVQSQKANDQKIVPVKNPGSSNDSVHSNNKEKEKQNNNQKQSQIDSSVFSNAQQKDLKRDPQIRKQNNNQQPNQPSLSKQINPIPSTKSLKNTSNESNMANQPHKSQTSSQILSESQQKIPSVKNKSTFEDSQQPSNIPILATNSVQSSKIANNIELENKVEKNESQQQKIQMKPEQMEMINLLNMISHSKLTPECRSQFEVGPWKENIKNRHCYLTNFFINADLASFGICSPLNDGNYQIVYWGVLVGSQQKSNFLFKKYLQYLQKFTELDQIYIQSPAFSETGFIKQGDTYVRQRVCMNKKQLSFTPFLQIQCSNICIKQDDKEHSIFYSEEIQDFKSDTTSTCQQIAKVNEKALAYLLDSTKTHPNLKSMKEVNETLLKYEADTYETSEQINVGNCKLLITMDNLAIKRNQFYIEKGYFMTKGINILFKQQTKTSIFKIEMDKENVDIYFGKNFQTITHFLKLCNPKAQGPNKQFAFKMFSKQLYGRLKNELFLHEGCYGNWEIDFVWQDQLKGVITKPLPQANFLFGPQNFFVGILKKEKLLFGFQINSNDYIF